MATRRHPGSLLLLIPLALATASIGRAQHGAPAGDPPPPVTGEQGLYTPWPGATFEVAIAGDFLGRQWQSVCVVRGGVPWLLFQPIRNRGYMQVANATCQPTGVTGIIGFPQSSSVTKKVILMASATDTQLATYDQSSGQFSFASQPALVSAGWNGAAKFTVRQDQGANIQRFAACAADGMTVLVGNRDTTGNLVHTAAIPMGTQILDIHLMDWDRDGVVDVFVDTQNGNGVFRPNGVPITSCSFFLAGIKGAAVRRNGLDEVAAVINFPAGLRKAVFSNAGTAGTVSSCASWPAQMYAVPDDPTATDQVPRFLAAFDIDGDSDGDGASELLMTRRGTFWQSLIKMPNGPTLFLPTLTGSMPTGGNPALNHCNVVWEDLDGDGIVDFLALWDSVSASAGGWVIVPRFDGILRDSTPTFFPTADYGNGTLNLTFSSPVAGGNKRLDAVRWHQAGPTGGVWPYLDPAALPNTPSLTIAGSTIVGNPLTISMQLQPNSYQPPTWPDRDHYFVELQILDNTTNALLWTETIGLTMIYDANNTDTELFQHLDSLPVIPGRTSNHIYINPTPNPDPGQENGSIRIGGIVTERIEPPRPSTQGPTDG